MATTPTPDCGNADFHAGREGHPVPASWYVEYPERDFNATTACLGCLLNTILPDAVYDEIALTIRPVRGAAGVTR